MDRFKIQLAIILLRLKTRVSAVVPLEMCRVLILHTADEKLLEKIFMILFSKFPVLGREYYDNTVLPFLLKGEDRLPHAKTFVLLRWMLVKRNFAMLNADIAETIIRDSKGFWYMSRRLNGRGGSIKTLPVFHIKNVQDSFEIMYRLFMFAGNSSQEKRNILTIMKDVISEAPFTAEDSARLLASDEDIYHLINSHFPGCVDKLLRHVARHGNRDDRKIVRKARPELEGNLNYYVNHYAIHAPKVGQNKRKKKQWRR